MGKTILYLDANLGQPSHVDMTNEAINLIERIKPACLSLFSATLECVQAANNWADANRIKYESVVVSPANQVNDSISSHMSSCLSLASIEKKELTITKRSSDTVEGWFMADINHSLDSTSTVHANNSVFYLDPVLSRTNSSTRFFPTAPNPPMSVNSKDMDSTEILSKSP